MAQLKIGSVLSREIKRRRLRLKEIAKETGISLSTLHEWQNNRAPRDPVAAKRLADFLGVSLNELLFDEVEQHSPLNINAVLKEDLLQGTFEITLRRVHLEKNKK